MAARPYGAIGTLSGSAQSILSLLNTIYAAGFTGNERVNSLTLKAESTNTGPVYFGASDLDESASKAWGYLLKGEAVTLEFTTHWIQLDKLFVKGTNNEKVYICAVEY